MLDTLKEYQKVRKRWLKAKRSGDEIMAGLWEKVGKTLRKQLEARGLLPEKAKKIFKKE